MIIAMEAADVSAMHERIQWGARTYGPLLRAAIDLLAAVDAQNDKPVPLKYSIPYGAVNALRDAIESRPQLPTVHPSMELSDAEIWKFWHSRPEVQEGEEDSMEAQFVAAVRGVIASIKKESS